MLHGLHVGLRTERSLGRILVMSGYLLESDGHKGDAITFEFADRVAGNAMTCVTTFASACRVSSARASPRPAVGLRCRRDGAAAENVR